MDDLIRRSNAIKAVSKPYNEKFWDYVNQPISNVVNILKSIPAVEPKQGEWIIDKVYYSGNGKLSGFNAKCSECSFTYKTNYSDYCPRCGAKMKIDKWWKNNG